MLAHWIESSVMFQNGDVFGLYAIIFGFLAVVVVVNYISAVRAQQD